ncbi:isocitrate lyase/PEP mutase family protein [Rhodoferax aquaticus]|uniref:Isocitrate lyase/phosphoenolpyruvate mutase family protein n=1 Tax=Rhodoferax aquaticus TaxID=2527691 RepID=A0A515EJ75_9BURK|nr:isocitrate lyase/phosphoenolpyruvate mutase family protein [Rhodoferax aquaticus]QDL52703.1 isocitrate lyase/phosphoenolpyruvate mutase family protein [Rhodoferax aquaticus]
MTHPLATQFHALHHSSQPLVLPNAWDAASAALFQHGGAPAIATSSAALAWSLGYADGGQLPRTELLAAVHRLQRVLRVPLTLDIEDGYSDDPQAVAALVCALAALGVAGINVEDGAHAPAVLVEKIRSMRHALGATPMFINARTDVVLRGLASKDTTIRAVIERATLYQAAGASGLFVPGMTSAADATEVARACELPLNLMLLPDMPSISSLFNQGVKRFTTGPASFLAAYGQASRCATELLQTHRTEELFKQATTYDSLNALFP